uniref:Uncharacterized protein n=1 Tax=Lepeophtheirus salmonis TaxID=72036 RepID=A0A0K2VF41_LEPSM
MNLRYIGQFIHSSICSRITISLAFSIFLHINSGTFNDEIRPFLSY